MAGDRDLKTEQDLLTLVTEQVEESLALDYKRSAALQNDDPSKNEISKDVSAFANSAGGTLVYGVVETGHLPTALDIGCDPAVIRREWLEQVINSRIQPRIQGIEITSVALRGANAGRVVYVVRVPQSHTAHQAFDKKYYRRFNYQSVPMEDFEIRDVMSRAKSPLIVPEIRLRRYKTDKDAVIYEMFIRLHNRGDFAAHHIKVGFALHTHFLHDQGHRFGYRDEGDDRWFSAYHQAQPFFPDEVVEIQDWGLIPPKLVVNHERYTRLLRDNPKVRWFIYADNMPRQEGEYALKDLVDY